MWRMHHSDLCISLCIRLQIDSKNNNSQHKTKTLQWRTGAAYGFFQIIIEEHNYSNLFDQMFRNNPSKVVKFSLEQMVTVPFWKRVSQYLTLTGP